VAQPVVTPLCEELRAGCSDVWEGLHEHPFLRELAAGTLPLGTFRFYLEQDLFFLPDYLRAIGLAIGRADGEEELELLVSEAQIVAGRELESVQALLRRVEELTGPGDADPEPAPTTVAYTGFLLATAARGDAIDVMTALLPCAWSYADIALGIADEIAEHPIYSDWIRFFAGAEYVESIAERRATLDRVAAGVGDSRRRRLGALFATAARLELAFWEMAYTHERWPDMEEPR
jgi:thiaminase/transcriptional activator TenA